MEKQGQHHDSRQSARVKSASSRDALQYFKTWVCPQWTSFYHEPLARIKSPGPPPQISPGIAQIPSECRICGSGNIQVGGPIWSAELHNREFVEKVLETVKNSDDRSVTHRKNIEGLLVAVMEEDPSSMLYWDIPSISRVVKCLKQPTGASFRSAISRLGFNVSVSHAMPTAVKTNASPEAIWSVMQAWTKEAGKGNCGSVGEKILHREIPGNWNISFEVLKEQVRDKAFTRFAPNPEKNWGPKSRPKPSKKPRENSEDGVEDISITEKKRKM